MRGGRCRGNQNGGTHPRGADESWKRHQLDRAVFQRLLDNHRSIDRRVEKLPNGIRSLTLSNDREVVALLHAHVPAMHRRLREGFPLRRWDPLYAAIFEQADTIGMEIHARADGVEVIETSDDPHVVGLIQAHAEAVSAFVAHGHAAASRPSPMPVNGDQ